MMRRLLLAILAIGGLIAPGEASTLELEQAVWNALKFNQTTMSPEDRRGLAQAALDYWMSFDERVPRNSPAAAEWVQSELDTTDPTRVGHVFRSPEYGLYMLTGTSSNCVDIFQKMLPTIGGDKAIELYFWLKATICYHDAEGLASYLQIAKLSNGRVDDTFKMQFFISVMTTIGGKLANSIISE